MNPMLSSNRPQSGKGCRVPVSKEKEKAPSSLLSTRDCLKMKREHGNVSLDMHQPFPSMGMHTHPPSLPPSFPLALEVHKLQISGVWQSYLGNISPWLSPPYAPSQVPTAGPWWRQD